MGKLQFRRGNKSNLPTGDSGEPLLATDSEQLYVGTPAGNKEIQLKGSTTDYTLYVATAALGGVSSASGATGKALLTGTADAGSGGTTLYDAAGTFTSAAHLNKAIYNATTDVWAKITAVSSSTNLTVDVSGAFAAGNTYVITNAFNNIPEAFTTADTGFNANITIRVSPGAMPETLTLIGKTAGAAKTLTLQGSTTTTTTISGETSIYQKIYLKNLTFTKRVFEYFGADVDWTTCVTSGDDGFLILKSTSVANVFRTSSVVVIENDPAVFTNIASTVTKGYTLYVATSTYGGDDAVGDGLKITQGTATASDVDLLTDSTANFNATDHLNKTVYNSTDDTWAKITGIVSTTQVNLSANIMANGEAYVIANAVATIQKAVDLIPGVVNCNTTIKASNGTYTSGTKIQGKALSGAYNINVEGTMGAALSSGTSTGSNVNLSMGAAGVGIIQATLNDTGKAWTATSLIAGTDGRDFICIKAHTSTAADRPVTGANWRTYWSYAGSSGLGAAWVVTTAYAPGTYDNKMVVITGGTGAGQWRVIDWTKATQLKIVGLWDTLPDATSTYKIVDWATIIDLSALSGVQHGVELIGQKELICKHLKILEWSGSSTENGVAIYGKKGSSFSVFYCLLSRSRIDQSGDGIRADGFSVLDRCEASILEEASGTKYNIGFYLENSSAPNYGPNIRNSKILGSSTGISLTTAFKNTTPTTGDGIVIRASRNTGYFIGSFSRGDMGSSIISGATSNGIFISAHGYCVMRANLEISDSGGDGIKGDGFGMAQNAGGGGTAVQVNNNGGWGINMINLSFGKNISTVSYTGNASGTFTADDASLYSAAGAKRTPVHTVEDSVTLVSGAATVTLTAPATFTSATTYTVNVTRSANTNFFKVVNNSGSSFTITSAILTDTDTVRYTAIGS